MLRSILPLLFAAACAPTVTAPSAAVEERWEAWVWQPEGRGDGTFLLVAPSGVARDLADLARVTRYETRRATPDDFREPWPVVNARPASGDVAWEVGRPDDPALVNFWVELMVAYTGGEPLGTAGRRFVETVL